MKKTGDSDRIAVYLLKPFARACKEFDLLASGDRVAVAVSGGKDSRALLELLLRYRRRVPYGYDLVALHVAGDAVGFPSLRSELEPWFQELGVEYRFVPLELPPGEPWPLDCFRCSWNRRKALFKTAVEMECKKLAFGHNADDAAATALMNLLFQGHLETMAPRLEFFDGAVTVVRPLIYLPEKDLDRYGKAAGFSCPPQCPQGLTSKTVRVKAFLRQFGSDQEQIRANLWRAARREMNF
jgi:tRNA(Ile)-lysidine synthase TilS/MesJ